MHLFMYAPDDNSPTRNAKKWPGLKIANYAGKMRTNRGKQPSFFFFLFLGNKVRKRRRRGRKFAISARGGGGGERKGQKPHINSSSRRRRGETFLTFSFLKCVGGGHSRVVPFFTGQGERNYWPFRRRRERETKYTRETGRRTKPTTQTR